MARRRPPREPVPALPAIPNQPPIRRSAIAEALRGTADVIHDTLYSLAASVEQASDEE
jgi:hypothetical protein